MAGSFTYRYVGFSSVFSFGAAKTSVAASINRKQHCCPNEFHRKHRCLVTDCCDDTTCGGKGLIAVASNNDYLSMDVGLQRGIDAISMNECLPDRFASDACER
jgi:hypothetical protein